MIKRAFSVYDNKAKTFSTPFFEVHTGQATRAFSDAVATKDHPFARHPNDYILYEIGTYNDESATLTNHTENIHVAIAVQFAGMQLPTEPTLFDQETGELK
uniref:phage ORF5 protein n=1 Tax=Shewanella sp. TaxID=50422 RepID=UPI00404756F4